ncbi:MAG TPA: hypothetical protein VG167_03480 [Verrucomicrobiae bacterium]|nr:hypothetical protein [Verrucomicrobiae bacterium]
MKAKSNRRIFLKTSAAAGLGLPLLHSFEERVLANQEIAHAPPSTSGPHAAAVPCGAIGKVKISRLICGGNLISGFAHSRDLIYVSPLLKQYFTDAKILETWALCEQHGINTMILNPSDTRAAALYQKHRSQGGRIQYLAQLGPDKENLRDPVTQAKAAGAVGAFLLGNYADAWTREGDVKRIGQLLSLIKAEGLIAGVAAHELRTVQAVEQANLNPDFYLKTLHSTQYWSTRRPDQSKEVIDNFAVDNYWCLDPQQTINYMSELRRPWIAYKVLAAGAIHPRAGFRHAFENGADFVAAGMFDFQIAEDVAIANEMVPAARNRDREWCA